MRANGQHLLWLPELTLFPIAPFLSTNRWRSDTMEGCQKHDTNWTSIPDQLTRKIIAVKTFTPSAAH